VRAPATAWIVSKGTLQSLQECRLIVLDLEEILPALLDDMRTERSLCKQGVTGDQDIIQVNLAQQGQGMGELVLALADGELRQHRSAPTGECAEQVHAGQVLLLGPADGLAVDGHWFESDRRFKLRLDPATQRCLEGANIQTREDAMQRTDTWCTAAEAKDRAAPRLVRSTPLSDREQAASTAQHPATDKRKHRRQGMTPTRGAPMIGYRSQRRLERRNLIQAGQHCASLAHLPENR
jgi:hypothetical protein